MRTGEHDEPAGDSRPTADEGTFTLMVIGEIFTVRIRPDNTSDYTWESGPNKAYGFSSSRRVAGDPSAACPAPTVDEHRESIRDFLGLINPETGYIGD
ncbi:hypothetical protein [Rhodococcus marinonascens]|uniref:hypothetical protein n=1 Tax=Rhodococcus marinonascens TaxID=38311 RepID=UPI000934B0C4|nr:hypothetical protein [Rhodococcus marinonascens]